MNALAPFIDKLQSVLMSPGSNFSVPSPIAAFGVAFGFLAYRERQRRGHVLLAS